MAMGRREEGGCQATSQGQRREFLREEVLLRMPLFAMDGYTWPEQIDPRRWSHLAAADCSLRAASCYNKRSGGVEGTEPLKCGKRTEQQLGCKTKNESCSICNLCHGGDNGLDGGTKSCGLKMHSLSADQVPGTVLLAGKDKSGTRGDACPQAAAYPPGERASLIDMSVANQLQLQGRKRSFIIESADYRARGWILVFIKLLVGS